MKERSLAVSTSVSPRVSQMQQQVQSEMLSRPFAQLRTARDLAPLEALRRRRVLLPPNSGGLPPPHRGAGAFARVLARAGTQPTGGAPGVDPSACSLNTPH